MGASSRDKTLTACTRLEWIPSQEAVEVRPYNRTVTRARWFSLYRFGFAALGAAGLIAQHLYNTANISGYEPLTNWYPYPFLDPLADG